MKALFHSIAALSIGLWAGVPALAAVPSPYYGRWTVNEAKPVFTTKGRMYKTIDIAPCGKDFCGVSVGDKGECGPVLFRFLMKHADAEELQGHAKWGTATKNVVIYARNVPPLELYLGDGYDFGDRSGNMPKFHGEYKRIGNARCLAR